jgi:hypothetical protein
MQTAEREQKPTTFSPPTAEIIYYFCPQDRASACFSRPPPLPSFLQSPTLYRVMVMRYYVHIT